MNWIEKFKQALPASIDFAKLERTGENWEEHPKHAALSALIRSGMVDAQDYLARYKDVAEADIDPLWHFVMHGVEEGRYINSLGEKAALGWLTGSNANETTGDEFDPESEDSLSVMIPTYNAEKYLQRCVSSVLSQTHSNFELIIYNDGSTDGTAIIATELAREDGRIRFIDSVANRGESYGRNQCIREARGNYCTFIDADDFFCEDSFLEKLLHRVRETRADIGIGPALRIRNNKKIIDPVETGIFSGLDAAQKYLNRGFGTHACWSKIYRSSLAKKVHVNEYGYSEDVPFVIECLIRATSVVATDISGYLYDISTVSSWRPEKATPLHFYSSLRILPEIINECWQANIELAPFLKLWVEDHGKRIRDYLAQPANLAHASTILGWFGWLNIFFEHFLPELRFYSSLDASSSSRIPETLTKGHKEYIFCLRAKLERRIKMTSEVEEEERKERKGITIWAEHLGGGGLERVCSQLGEALSSEYDITYILDHPERNAYTVDGSIIKADPYDLRLHRFLARSEYIFDFHWKTPGGSYPLCKYMIEKHRIKYMPTIHNTLTCDAYFGEIDSALVSQYASKTEFPGIICVTESVKQSMEERYGENAPYRVLHNPVDYESCVNAPVITRPYPYILFAARLNATEHKGIDLLVQAWNLAAARHGGIRLVMAGEGKLEEGIKGFIAENGLEDSIEMIGFTERIYSWMKGALFTIMPSRWEGSGNVVTESLACGTPVLASGVGIAPELIEIGVNGMLVDATHVVELADAIDRMVETAPEMRAEDCSSSVAHLDISNYMKRIMAILP